MNDYVRSQYLSWVLFQWDGYAQDLAAESGARRQRFKAESVDSYLQRHATRISVVVESSPKGRLSGCRDGCIPQSSGADGRFARVSAEPIGRSRVHCGMVGDTASSIPQDQQYAVPRGIFVGLSAIERSAETAWLHLPESRMAIMNCTLIAIEGTHCTGKSTLVHAITAYYKSHNVHAASFTEVARASAFVEQVVIHGKGCFDIAPNFNCWPHKFTGATPRSIPSTANM